MVVVATDGDRYWQHKLQSV